MRIYFLSKILAAPIVLISMGLAYYQYASGQTIGGWIILPVILLVVLYISHPYIDFWYHKKYPIPLDEAIKNWLNSYSSFYKGLSEEEKTKYDYRMSLYLEAREFMSVGSEQKELPEDIKAIVASNAIQMNFHKKDILVGNFDRLFVYKHPFPTPQNQFLHSVETQEEDGVIIYSLEHLIPGITNPELYYNIGMHGYVEAFTMAYPDISYPTDLNGGWDEVESISGLKKKLILSTLGFEKVDLFIVLATCYFVYPLAFKQKMPQLKAKMDRIFIEQDK